MDDPFFTYFEKVVPESYFEILYIDIKDKVATNAQRKSCLFNLHPISLFEYKGIPMYDEVPKSLKDIRTIVEKKTGEIYDYVLVHIYPTGQAQINWHFDFEALNSTICSVSLGETRKFRLKEKGKKGYDHQFLLKSGDVIVMKKPLEENNFIGCQSKYLHCVPKEMKVKEPRINLTFRQYEIE